MIIKYYRNISMINIITIGFRCTTDKILDLYNMRKFSGPFSSLLVDLETSLILLKTNFKDYFTDIKKIKHNGDIKYLSHWRMTKEFWVNTKFTECIQNKNIYDLSRYLIWNHHNMYKQDIIETFKRRINRIITLLNNDNCILLFIGKIYKDNNIDEFIHNSIEPIVEKHNLSNKLVYVLPFTNPKYNNYDTRLYYSRNKLNIYLLKTTPISKLVEETVKQNIKVTPLLDTDHNDSNINWTGLIKNIKSFLDNT